MVVLDFLDTLANWIFANSVPRMFTLHIVLSLQLRFRLKRRLYCIYYTASEVTEVVEELATLHHTVPYGSELLLDEH